MAPTAAAGLLTLQAVAFFVFAAKCKDFGEVPGLSIENGIV
jgi:hypothetical protein